MRACGFAHVFVSIALSIALGVAARNAFSADVAKTIFDNFDTYEDLQQGLKDAGIESSNLIIGIDFTSSNKEQGEKTYAPALCTRPDGANFKNLHYLAPDLWPNPYEQVISITGKTLDAFDEDKIYPVFGFGDVHTKAVGTFDIKVDDQYCKGIEQVRIAYRKAATDAQMSGPTSFAPLIEKAMHVVYENDASYHILVIITDGVISHGYEAINADVFARASLLPMSIIIVGVGDGPFDQMSVFDDDADNKLFDNVQFMNYIPLSRLS